VSDPASMRMVPDIDAACVAAGAAGVTVVVVVEIVVFVGVCSLGDSQPAANNIASAAVSVPNERNVKCLAWLIICPFEVRLEAL
jgi:hypothetical protein